MNDRTKQIMLVGDIREVLSKLGEALSTTEIAFYLPNETIAKKYEALEKEYEKFYELPIQERLYKSGMATIPEKGN